MDILITNSANGRYTKYTEQDIKDEVRSLRKQNGVQQRCHVTIHIKQQGGSPVLEIRDIQGNSARTVI